MTLEERVKEYSNELFEKIHTHKKYKFIEDELRLIIEETGKAFAKEQRQIDIEKACELRCKYCNASSHTECIYRRNHGEPNLRCMEYGVFKMALEEG